jgi:ABC-2 type transport system permease protein
MQLLALIWKELLVILKDKRSRIAILLPPITQLFIFGLASTLDVKNVSVGILNRDNGEKGIELIERFIGSPIFKEIIYLKDVEEITPFIENQKGLLVVSINEQFSRDIDSNKQGTVQVITDGRKYNSAQIVSNYVSMILEQFNQDIFELKPAKYTIIQRTWFNPNFIYIWYNIPCLVATLSMLTCLVVTSQSIARERELGTFDQLLISPLLPYQIAIGKMIPGIIIGVLEGVVMMVMGILIFDVPFNGSVLHLILTLTTFVTAISGFGLFISSLCSTQQQAMMGVMVFMIPSVLLSGFATPIENMPKWLQTFTYLIPIRYALINFKGHFLKGIPLDLVLQNEWQVCLIALASMYGAAKFFREKIQ